MTMKSTEVRIGNLFEDRKGRICRVEEINLKEFKAPAMYGGMTSLPNNPIPITEEWLLKFGFKTDDHFRVFYLGFTIEVSFNKPKTLSRLSIQYGYHSEGPEELEHILYIHQLQNLYFSLTGEELKTQTK